MDMRPKTGADSLRGVKTKGDRQKICPKPQQKATNTLLQWLGKHQKQPSTHEACQIKEDVEMAGDCGFQSTSAQVMDCQNAENPTLSDDDEETQPLTPQELYEETPVSPPSNDSAGGGLMQTLSHNYGGLEKKEAETCSESSVKHKTKITDFFSGTSSTGLPVRSCRPDTAPEKQDADEDTSAVVKPKVKWLGTPINDLKRMPECGGLLPPLRNAPGHHTVMIQVCDILSFLFSYSQHFKWLCSVTILNWSLPVCESVYLSNDLYNKGMSLRVFRIICKHAKENIIFKIMFIL